MVPEIIGKTRKTRTWVRTENCPLFRAGTTGHGDRHPRNRGRNE